MKKSNPDRQKEIARAGGVAAHDPNHPGKRGHEWDSETARRAGEKGGKARHGKQKAVAQAAPQAPARRHPAPVSQGTLARAGSH